MSNKRLELKVGAFVVFCLIVFAVLMLQFSKSSTLFRPTYAIILDTANVGGLRANAMVLMSGVRVGTVSGTVLSPVGTNVAIHLKIYSEFIIHDDALFKIESSGFLGDQYVAIYPGASSDFTTSHIKDLGSLVTKIRAKADPVSKFLFDNLDPDTTGLIANYPSDKFTELNPPLIMAQFLNRVTAGSPIYDMARFQNVTLRPETQDLLDLHPQGQGLQRLNRRLLEDAYPSELGRQGAILKSGDVAHAQEPFNLQEVARSTAGFIERLDNTAKKLDGAINDIRRLALNDKTLTDLSNSIANFKATTDKASVAMDNINLLIQSNSTPLSGSISNFTAFSEELRGLSARAQGILATNEPQIATTISNLQTSTVMLTNLLGQIQSGKGLAGALIEDQALAGDVAALAKNLSVTTSNLNQLGLWHFLWYKPKPKTEEFGKVPPASKFPDQKP